MGTIALNFGEWKDAELASKRAADVCREYREQIQQKVVSKLEALPGNTSINVLQASYYAQNQMKNLDQACEQYLDFGGRLKSTKAYISEQDQFVFDQLKEEGRQFRENCGMHTSAVFEWIKRMTVGIRNSSGIGRFISEKMQKKESWIGERIRDVKRWFDLDGGKYILKTASTIVAAATGTALILLSAGPALAAAIGAGTAAGGTAWTTITAAAGLIGAVICLADQSIQMISQKKSYDQNKEDPAWAKRTSEVGSVSDYLRTTLFDSPEQNRNSEQWADTYDLASLSVNTIDAVNSAQGISKFVQKLNDQGIHNVFQTRAFLNKEGKPDFKEFFVGLKDNGEILKNACRLTPYDQIVAKQKEMVPIRLFKNANQVNKTLNQTFVGIENMIHTNDIRGLGKGVLEFTREKIPLWDYIHESRGQIKDVFA